MLSVIKVQINHYETPQINIKYKDKFSFFLMLRVSKHPKQKGTE